MVCSMLMENMTDLCADSQLPAASTDSQASRTNEDEDLIAPSLKKRTVKDLRALLKERDLPTKGLKAELIQTLLDWQALHK